MASRPRILLADDHPVILEHARPANSLDRLRVVDQVNDGRAAVDAASELCPDLVVVDVMMPELDGFNAARELRRRGCAAKVVFLTVLQNPEYVSAALQSGGLAYVLKSRMYADLTTAIRLALAGCIFVSEMMA